MLPGAGALCPDNGVDEMSMVFDGVIVVASPGRVEQALEQIHSPLDLTFQAVVSGVLAVYAKGGRRQFDVEEDKRIAASLSKRLGRSLLVLWDDRIGCDQAYLYHNGHKAAEFGSADERYVPLNENGEPDREGHRLTLEELSEGEEYECIRHAIDAGLEALGVGEQVSLRNLMEAFYKFD